MPKVESRYKINNTFDNTLINIFPKRKEEKIIIKIKTILF